MSLRGTSVLLAGACLCCRLGGAGLEFLPDKEPQRVFAGKARKITIVLHNALGGISKTDIRARLYQTSTATAAPLTQREWKTIEMLPGQTVLDFATIDFPAVNAETPFFIQWLEDSKRVLGRTEVLVYPTNLLSELKLIAEAGQVGVLDPKNELKPLLKLNGIEYMDLEDAALEDFQGKLAILGPFSIQAQIREGFGRTVRNIAQKGVAVVWIQAPQSRPDRMAPTYYVVQEGKGRVIVAQAEFVLDLAGNPKSQLDLVHLCRLACNPMPPMLPDLQTEP